MGLSGRRWTLPLSCLAVVVLGMDNTILNVALPTLSRPPVSATTVELQWIVDAYLLLFACLLLLGGACGDRFGHRRALMIGMAVFGGGSALAAAVSTPETLIVARAVMGAGAAFVLPTTLSMLVEAYPDQASRFRAITVWSAASGLGVALGPAVGGALLEWFPWQSIFLINIPVAVVVMVLAPAVVPQRADGDRPGVDWLGAVLSILAFTALVFAIVEAPERGWSDTVVVCGFALTAVALVLFVVWERRVEHPMLDVRLFGRRRFAAPTAILALAFFAVFGCLFPLTLYLQFVEGYSAVEAGVRLLPVAIALMAASPVAARLSPRLGDRATIVIGMVALGCGLTVLSLATGNSTGYGAVLAATVLMGFGTGLVLPLATGLAVGELRSTETGVGSAVNQAVRQIGVALGVAVLGSLTALGYRTRAEDALQDWAGTQDLTDGAVAMAREQISGALEAAQGLDQQAGQELSDLARTAFREAMADSLLVAVGAVALGVLLALVLPSRSKPGRGQEPTSSAAGGGPGTDRASPT
ncbi:MFS transporter [Nocardiopsis sp. L17-MgMaSL7]|uniref:MFS transporter n=1 Tax=Nocardiopsis sp. L17-MgMaSL7 TaxID=1938893 RepID=UPI000D70B54A|nr:MFS transporter [Nocardiopsis sp. L17-MgMaSL7]PWV58089.1 EmrB/QacA subfamily drug resistance transporter [Nocardiopsis sp. L17-MgMaSL7]